MITTLNPERRMTITLPNGAESPVSTVHHDVYLGSGEVVRKGTILYDYYPPEWNPKWSPVNGRKFQTREPGGEIRLDIPPSHLAYVREDQKPPTASE